MTPSIILYIETNAITVFVLVLLLHEQRKMHADNYLYDNKLFAQLLIANVIILIFDTMMWSFDGQTFLFARELNLIASALYYTQTPFLGYLWLIYAYYKMTLDTAKTKKLMVYSSIPMIVNAFLSISSIWTGWYFTVDAANIYHRGNFGFFIYAFLCYFYMVLTSVMVFLKRKHIDNNTRTRKLYISLILFPLPALVVSIVQIVFYGISFIWNITMISLLVIFINFQNQQLKTDYLTGLFNRRQLESFMKWKSKNGVNEPNMSLYAVMIDIDDFKSINDRFGHDIGDDALEMAARILRESFSKKDFLARYGGDEFLAIVERENDTDIAEIISLLNEKSEEFNKSNAHTYKIKFSVGFGVCDFETGILLEEAVKQADATMYAVKTKKKSDSCYGQ